MASIITRGKKRTCSCPHEEHCACKRKPPPPPKPVTVKPERAPIEKWLSLNGLAWAFKDIYATPITVMAVSGAIRALHLENDKDLRTVVVRVGVLFRQQTMVDSKHAQKIYDHIAAKKGL